MSNKRLPKATQSTLSSIRDESRAAPEAVSEAATVSPRRASGASSSSSSRAAAPALPDEPTPAPTPVPAAASASAGAPAVADKAATAALEPIAPDLSLHRARASLIVERFATYSALGGAIPLPLIDSLSVGVTVYEMIEALAKHYETPFKRDQAKALSAALVGALAAPGIGQLATGLLRTILPWAWIIGAVASATSAAMFTRYVGEAFVNHFESGGTALDVNVTRIRAQVLQRTAGAR